MIKINYKWNVTLIAIWVWLIISWLSFLMLYKGYDLNKNLANSRTSLFSQLDIISKNIFWEKDKWDIITWESKIDLKENTEVNVSIPKKEHDWTLDVLFDSWSTKKYIGLKIEKSLNSEFKINANFWVNWWYIIYDSSTWDSVTRPEKIKEQTALIKNNNINNLWSFIKYEISKIWKAWSYLTFDLWDYKFLNSFKLKMKNIWKNIIPEIIWLTFDNGVTYLYTFNKNHELQSFMFNETKTRYVKLDIIKTTDWYINESNIVVTNNIERNILESEINYTINSNTINFSVPSVSTIIWAKYYNLYLKINWKLLNKPILTKLSNNIDSSYSFKTWEIINSFWIELCSDIWKCNPIVYKNVN